jgi:hypothetical protein
VTNTDVRRRGLYCEDETSAARKKGVLVERARYLGVDELPARPDRSTGLPRPPRAPGYSGAPLMGERGPAGAPDPPPGQGPVWVWYRGNRRDALAVAACTLVLIVVMFTLGNGFDWMTDWFMWAFFGLCVFGVYWLQWSGVCAVGVEWLARGRRWVRVYELVDVSYRTLPGGARLRLRDSAGRRLTVKVKALRSDRVIYDSVYNGILRSVIAGGARTNHQLHVNMQVPYPKPDSEDGPRAASNGDRRT